MHLPVTPNTRAKAPVLPRPSGIRKQYQDEFEGLDHNESTTKGEWWDMRNLTSEYDPWLATRPERRKYKKLTQPWGLFEWEGLCWVDGDGFYFNGQRKGTVARSKKTFAAIGDYIIVMPDKAYYNTYSGQFGSLEASWSGTLTFTNGQYVGEEAKANTLQASGVNWATYFKAGDAVTIEGCTKHASNNKTPIIREVAGDKLYFYEYTFDLDGEDGTTPYTEPGRITIKRTMPDLLYMCENENRLWGCDKRTIYSSKLGDPFNWNCFDGVGTDSYAVDTGSEGSFTGCYSYLGVPMFFKETVLYKVYGTMPSNYEVTPTNSIPGVMEGSSRSIAVAGSTLFYLSPHGIMAYSGATPRTVAHPFGTDRYKLAAAGSTGGKYYISMQGPTGYLLFAYDVERGMWHIEDDKEILGFAYWDKNLYMLQSDGQIWITGNIVDPPADSTPEGPFDWYAESGDILGDYARGSGAPPNKKHLTKFQMRTVLYEGSWVELWVRYDSNGDWKLVDRKEYEKDMPKRSHYMSVKPVRVDHFRVKLVGHGQCKIQSISHDFGVGSELRSLPGTQ